jgi:hypothetical protein
MSGNFNIETSVLKFLSFFIKQDTARTFFSKNNFCNTNKIYCADKRDLTA